MAKKTEQNKRFWEFKNFTDTTADLYIYGEISDYSWWGDEVTPKQFADDLEEVKNVDTLNVRINSVGGDVFAAHAIYSLLKSAKPQIMVYIDGLAASAATIIMMAGDKVMMPPNAMIMIHNPWTVARGEAKDFEKSIEILSKVKDSIILAYEAKTGLDKEELSALMDAETWMTGQEAYDKGFIDELIQNEQVAASISDSSMLVNGIQFSFGNITNKDNLLNKFKPNEEKSLSKEEHLESLVNQFAKGIKDIFRTSNSKSARIDRAKEQMNQLRDTLNSFGSAMPNALSEEFKQVFKEFLPEEEETLDNTENKVTETVDNKVVPVVEDKPTETFVTEEQVRNLITSEIQKVREDINSSITTTVENSNKNGFEALTKNLADTFKNQLEEVLKPIEEKVAEIENTATGSKAIEGQDYAAGSAEKVTNEVTEENMWNGFLMNAIPKDILNEKKYSESEVE